MSLYVSLTHEAVIETLRRVEEKCKSLRNAIMEYTAKSGSFIPTSEMLEELAQLEYYINVLLSRADYQVAVNRLGEQRKSALNTTKQEERRGEQAGYV